MLAYSDYRVFLRDYYQEQKLLRGGFTIRKFSHSAGVKSPNYLGLIIKGDRNLTDDMASRFAKALRLNPKERLYFLALVQYSQSGNVEEKQKIEHRLQELREQGQRKTLGSAQESFLRDWLHVAVREMVLLKDFQNHPAWIQKRLTTTVGLERIQAAWNFLIETGYVKMEQDRAVQSEPVLGTSDEVASAAVRSHQHQMMELARMRMQPKS